jgi:hypothetical protein
MRKTEWFRPPKTEHSVHFGRIPVDTRSPIPEQIRSVDKKNCNQTKNKIYNEQYKDSSRIFDSVAVGGVRFGASQ